MVFVQLIVRASAPNPSFPLDPERGHICTHKSLPNITL